MKFDIKKVSALGIGIAIFIITSYLIIPTGIPNTSIQPRIAILAFFSVIFGPMVGFLIGLFGHALADAIQWGSIWWSWVFAEAIFGLIIGLVFKNFNIEEEKFLLKQSVKFNVVQFISNLLIWSIIAPVLDILIYAEPVNKVFLQGIASTIVNTITVCIISTVLLKLYSQKKNLPSNLTKED